MAEFSHGLSPPPQDHIVYGVDFGTTFTGVTWALSDSANPEAMPWPSRREPMSFSNNFWGREDSTTAPLLTRLSILQTSCDDLKSFYNTRASIEEAYAKKLDQLSRTRPRIESRPGNTDRAKHRLLRWRRVINSVKQPSGFPWDEEWSLASMGRKAPCNQCLCQSITQRIEQLENQLQTPSSPNTASTQLDDKRRSLDSLNMPPGTSEFLGGSPFTGPFISLLADGFNTTFKSPCRHSSARLTKDNVKSKILMGSHQYSNTKIFRIRHRARIRAHWHRSPSLHEAFDKLSRLTTSLCSTSIGSISRLTSVEP